MIVPAAAVTAGVADITRQCFAVETFFLLQMLLLYSFYCLTFVAGTEGGAAATAFGRSRYRIGHHPNEQLLFSVHRRRHCEVLQGARRNCVDCGVPFAFSVRMSIVVAFCMSAIPLVKCFM